MEIAKYLILTSLALLLGVLFFTVAGATFLAAVSEDETVLTRVAMTIVGLAVAVMMLGLLLFVVGGLL